MKAALAELRAIARTAHNSYLEDQVERWIQEWVVELNALQILAGEVLEAVKAKDRFTRPLANSPPHSPGGCEWCNSPTPHLNNQECVL